MRRYDYIFTGTGAAGLSLVIRMIASGKFYNKKILLIDSSEKTDNDRTWCFWENKPGVFEPVVYKRWSSLWFHDQRHSRLHEISPYQYKLIRGIDFYAYCFRIISAQPNITVEQSHVDSCFSDDQETFVVADGRKISAGYIFNSIRFDKVEPAPGQYYMLQHFKGWFIETAAPAFNPDQATLMDFRVSQDQGTSFVYIMPFSENRALVEYTLFSKQVLASEKYDLALTGYCREFLHLDNYVVNSEEFGVIPMTNYPFQKAKNRMINIGTAGGQTKASSGYTFQFIQKQSQQIVDALISSGEPAIKGAVASRRFDFYDATLLNILDGKKLAGADIFGRLFGRNKMPEIMKFLDNETSVFEELKLISSLPKTAFLKAAIQHMLSSRLKK